MRAPTSSPRVLAALAASAILLAAPWASTALAQTPQGPPPDQQQPAAQLLTAEQLDQLLAPIALYPDNLLGQILTASTYPLEDVMAARWSAANPNVKGPALETAMQQQTWDPSVKALTSVPQVLAMMSDKLDWTQSLGDAYLAQPDDCAAAIQRLRQQAQAAGNLQTTSQHRVTHIAAPPPVVVGSAPPPDYIVIEPVDPAIVYVPVYDPFVVFGPWPYPAYRPFFWSPPGYVAVGVIGFGAPIVVGAAIWAHYDWRLHHVGVNVVEFNRFNHTNLPNTLASQTWQHDPLHRGNIPYNNAALQQKFGNTASSNPRLNANQTLKTNLGTNPSSNPNNNKLINNNTITNLGKTGTGNNTGNTGTGNNQKGNTRVITNNNTINIEKNNTVNNQRGNNKTINSSAVGNLEKNTGTKTDLKVDRIEKNKTVDVKENVNIRENVNNNKGGNKPNIVTNNVVHNVQNVSHPPSPPPPHGNAGVNRKPKQP